MNLLFLNFMICIISSFYKIFKITSFYQNALRTDPHFIFNVQLKGSSKPLQNNGVSGLENRIFRLKLSVLRLNKINRFKILITALKKLKEVYLAKCNNKFLRIEVKVYIKIISNLMKYIIRNKGYILFAFTHKSTQCI